jgi:hypothetical protein
MFDSLDRVSGLFLDAFQSTRKARSAQLPRRTAPQSLDQLENAERWLERGKRAAKTPWKIRQGLPSDALAFVALTFGTGTADHDSRASGR